MAKDKRCIMLDCGELAGDQPFLVTRCENGKLCLTKPRDSVMDNLVMNIAGQEHTFIRGFTEETGIDFDSLDIPSEADEETVATIIQKYVAIASTPPL